MGAVFVAVKLTNLPPQFIEGVGNTGYLFAVILIAHYLKSSTSPPSPAKPILWLVLLTQRHFFNPELGHSQYFFHLFPFG